MSLIQTLNKSLVDFSINSATHPHESYDDVIDFLEIFKLLNFQSEEIHEERSNQESSISHQVLAFHSKIVEIHESLDLHETTISDIHESLESDERIISIPQKSYARDNSLEIIDDSQDYYNDFNKTVECITLKVSSQPWIFSPHHKVLSDNPLQALKSINNKLDIIPPPQQYNKPLKTLEVEKPKVTLEINEEITPALVHVNVSDYIVHEYIKYDCSFSPELSIKKYEALSEAVHNQVCTQIKMHNFNLADSIEIELYPEKLGRVKIKCDIDSDDKIILQVSTEKLTTLALLQHNALELKEIIARNFNDYHQDKTELSFSMSDGNSDHKQNEHNTHKQFSGSDIKTNTIVYFLHNGIINLVV